jgi:NAD(P)-dependent dehydrogenase (short-subunit alcohol dehydrogenase family)
MKISITGHTAGIGRSFARRLRQEGHEIVGISKREGHNIRNIPKILPMIVDCDIWINNAQAGYAQTELLYKVWESWQDVPNKNIWLISTMLTRDFKIQHIDGMTDTAVVEYKNQKRALEDAFLQLKVMPGSPKMILIRPGAVATQPGQVPDQHAADVDKWVDTIIDFYQIAQSRNLWPEEINLGFSTNIAKI